MVWRTISRRRFIENSVKGGLAVGLESKFGVLSEAMTANPPGPELSSGHVSLNLAGDPQQGYTVALLFNGEIFSKSVRAGEFSACFQNEERSVEDRVTDWKATSWSGNAARMTLQGECSLKNLNVTVFAEVEYEVLSPQVVRKRIRFRQEDVYMLFYQLSNRLEPTDNPTKFWSFDQVDCKGGPLHEYFPAAGFRTKSGLCVGLLTDSGHRNLWTRMIRRDGRPVKPALQRIPDARLYSTSLPDDRSKGDFFVQQTFGEILEVEAGEENSQKIVLPPVISWKKQGEATIKDNANGVATLSIKSSDDGVVIPFSAHPADVFALRVEYRSEFPVAIGMWGVDEQLHKLTNITQYNDGAAPSPGHWTEFKTTVFVPGMQGSGCVIFLSVAASEQSTKVDAPSGTATVEVRGLELRRSAAHTAPYHRLAMDKVAEKNVFIFADDKVPDTLRGHRLASQKYLADGLGCKGSDTEKVVYSDLMMLSWIAGPETFRPICAPSIWYSAAGEMYLRDSFFALNGIHNRELNESVFNLWGENQGTDGAINTLIEPNLANVERKSNDSTPLWLMWALLNRRRFGTELPMEKVRKAADYCLRTYDPHSDGVCWAQFVMGQLDVIRYPEGTSEICENQGILALTTRVIRELRTPGVSETISDERIARMEDLYRSYYDSARKFMRPARKINDAIGFADIFPEFLSLWIFGRKILSDEMVVNHLDRIPVMMPRKECPHPETGGVLRPIFIGLPEGDQGWKYFTESWHPMVSDSFATSYARNGMDGIYYNGGSWMRIEICGYVAGKLHGWSGATKAIKNRLWAELNIDPSFPTSQEYIATDPAHPFFGYHRVFAWNSFVLQALELGGLRSRDMDPEVIKK